MVLHYELTSEFIEEVTSVKTMTSRAIPAVSISKAA
jgi:hypothetical protein